MKGTDKSILAQIMALDPSTNIKCTNLKPVNETDEVLGVLSDDLKRVWVFLETLTKKSKEASEPIIEEIRERSREHEKAHKCQNHDKKDCEKFQEEGNRLKNKLEKIMFPHRQAKTFFWALVLLEFGLTEESELEVREGGVLVKTPPKETDPIANFIKTLGGLGGGIIQVSVGTSETPKGA